ncbi:MAG: hypothetical protein AB1941_16760 [Gemmatimonadota bacterium]
MKTLLEWLGENAAGVQTAASVVSLLIAAVVAWFGIYSIKLYRLEKGRARAEHMKFIVALANLATDFHELAEAYPAVRDSKDDGQLALLEHHVKRGQRDLESLRESGADVPPRVYFCLEAAARKLERLEHGLEPGVVRNPELEPGVFFDLRGVWGALLKAYEAIPRRQRRERWWHRDYVEERSAILWELALPKESAGFRKGLPWYQRLIDRFRGHRPPPKKRMQLAEDRYMREMEPAPGHTQSS